MQCEEPTTCLIDSLVDKVSGESFLLINSILIFKWIVNLCIRHRTRIEPNVDQVCFTLHWLTRLADQNNIINVRTVQVYFVVVFLRHISWHKALVFQWIWLHEACSHWFFYFIVEFFYTSDTDFFSFFWSPNRQRSTPEAWTWQVPVIEVVKPVAKTSTSCWFRLPVDGFVKFAHSLLASRATDKPRIEWIIKYWFVGTPTMWIAMDMFFNFENLASSF